MQRLTKPSWSWMKEINPRKQYVSATDHYVTINRLGHENIPHIWASVPMIIKACTPRNALLGRNMVIYASSISQLWNIFTKWGGSEFLGTDAVTAPAKAAFSSCPLHIPHTHFIQLFLIVCILIRPNQKYYPLHQNPQYQAGKSPKVSVIITNI